MYRPRLDMRHLRAWWRELCLATSGNYVVNSHTSLPAQCHVSRHRGHLLQVIVHRPAPSERLVIAIGVEGESADQFAVLSDDPDIGAGDQESDLAVLMGEADGDVAELAEVTEGDLSKGVYLVSTYAVVDGRWRSRGFGLDQGF